MKTRKWLPILLMGWPYLVLFLLYLTAGENASAYGMSILLLIVLTAVVYILNIINACTYKREDACQMAFWNMLIKLVHIPFYLIIFLIGAMALLVMVVPAFIFVSPFIAVMLAVIDFFLMLTSSAYGINALIRAKREGSVSTKFMIWNMIFHLLFVMDVISAVVVFVKLKKKKTLV